MKKWMFLVCLSGMLLSLSSCSSYYYSTLASNDRSGRYDVNKDFVIDNDSVCIIYNFHGEDGPVLVTVQNKMDEPLFVDWQRSALTVRQPAIIKMLFLSKGSRSLLRTEVRITGTGNMVR